MSTTPGSDARARQSPEDPAPNASALAERIRCALIDHAIATYEDAAARGLCAEGAWEAAVGAMRRLDLSQLTE